jgi:hypothetical protein
VERPLGLKSATGGLGSVAVRQTTALTDRSTTGGCQTACRAIAGQRVGLIERGEASVSAFVFQSVKARGQVRAEALAAQRPGRLGRGEASGPSIMPAQNQAIRQAGLLALGVAVTQATR